MKTYAYIHPVPFQRALRYDYAECSSSMFVDEWKESRENLKKKLSDFSQSEKEKNYTYQENALRYLLEKSRTNEEIIWLFLKKYEIFGRLHSHYEVDFRKGEEASPASLLDYVLFGEILAEYAGKRDCLQYLSTLLKLIDSFCGVEKSGFSPEEAQRILKLLDQETILVARLEEMS